MIYMAHREEETLQGYHCCNKELSCRVLIRRHDWNSKSSSPALIPVNYPRVSLCQTGKRNATYLTLVALPLQGRQS